MATLILLIFTLVFSLSDCGAAAKGNDPGGRQEGQQGQSAAEALRRLLHRQPRREEFRRVRTATVETRGSARQEGRQQQSRI